MLIVTPAAYLESVLRDSFDSSQQHIPQSVPARVRGVIFDGDDTLWLTEALYDDARNRARRIVERVGLDGAEWERLQRARDLENVTVLGHSATRFPTSCVEALALVGGDYLADRDLVRAKVLNAAKFVFDAIAPHREGAEALLEWLKLRRTRIALLTKGDAEVQERRIAGSGLTEYFDVISIVAAKSAQEFSRVGRELGLEADELVSVGNSVASDIRPSLEAGIYALWLPAYVWEYEQRHDPAVEGSLVQIDDLLEVKGVFDYV